MYVVVTNGMISSRSVLPEETNKLLKFIVQFGPLKMLDLPYVVQGGASLVPKRH